MMKRFCTLLLTLIVIFAFVEVSEAQINRRSAKKNNKRISKFKGRKTHFSKEKRYNFVAVSLNALNYFGDLAPLNKKASTDIGFTRPGIGVMFGHRFGPRYTLRASFTYGTVRGDDFDSADPNDENARFRYVRNLHFRNRIKELSVVGVFDLFENTATYISRVQWTPYAFAGLTLFHHNPQAFVGEDSGLPEAGTWVNLQPLGTEGQNADLRDTDANFGIESYGLIQIAIPFGVGIRYRLNQVLDLSFETGMRYLFTDYIDDVSQNYVDKSLLTSDLARYMSDRSTEEFAAVSGTRRDWDHPNVRRIVGDSYDPSNPTTIAGFGLEHPDNLRGNKDDKDLYFVTTIKVAYILGATFRRAKFR